MTTARARWLRIVGSAALLALLVVFARHVSWRAAYEAARGADARLIAFALVCNQLSLVIKGVRWWVFLRPVGVRSLSLVLRATYAGASLNNLVVAQGGEAARVLLVARASGVAGAQVASALALERVLDAVSYLTLLGGAALLLELPPVLMRWRALSLVALGLAACALFTLAAWPGERVESATSSSVGRVRASIIRFAWQLAEIGSPLRLGAAMVLSLAAWGLQVATYHAIALAAHLPVPLAASVAAMLTIGISFLVRATPGNVGVFQVIYVVTMGRFGIAPSPALAAALLIQVVQVVPTVALGTIAAYGLVGRRKVIDETRRSLS